VPKANRSNVVRATGYCGMELNQLVTPGLLPRADHEAPDSEDRPGRSARRQ